MRAVIRSSEFGRLLQGILMRNTSLGTKPSCDHKALLQYESGQHTNVVDKRKGRIVNLLTARQESEHYTFVGPKDRGEASRRHHTCRGAPNAFASLYDSSKRGNQ